MSHRALALKYRPQTFSDLVGQEHVSAVLSRAVEGGRVAHAYLFTGSRGVGKTTSARILAKALNCERRGAGGSAPGAFAGPDPCNACTSCTEIAGGVSLDVAEIDGASNRGIADVQALREKVRFTPTGGRHRVVIIDEVHQLSNDAFAALLKTLEEPPAHLVFIFATTDPQKLPDTIRSRTQRFDFARVPLRKVADRLLEIARREADDAAGVRFTLTEGAALLIAQRSEGSMRDAVSALDQVVSSGETDVHEELVRRVLGLADREAFFDLAEAIVHRDPRAALTALHAAFEKGLDARDLAEGLSEHIRHLLILKVDPEAADLVPASADDLQRLRAQTEGWSEHDLLRLLRLASESSWPMRDSPQPLIHLEAAVLQMATLESGETLAQLLQRLEALELRLGGAAPTTAPAKSRGESNASPESSGAGHPDPFMGQGRAASPPTRVPPASPRSIRASPGPAGARTPPGYTPPRTTPSGPDGFAPSPSATPVATPSAVALEPQRDLETIGSDAAPEAQAASVATLDDAPPDAATLARWERVIEGVNARKRMLGAFIQESQFLALTPQGILLGTDDLHRSVIDERENRALIADEVAKAFGRPLALRCTPIGPGAAPGPASAQDLKPLIDRTIAWFEGDLVRPGPNPETRG